MMNERIKELYNTVAGNDKLSFDSYLAEKFAELIVRECMSTILKESKWYWDKDEFESSNAIQNAARKVKKHFGVES
jgi:hypothetical protein